MLVFVMSVFLDLILAKVTFKLIEQNTFPIRDLIDIKEVESLLIKVFKFRIKCNNDYVICQHIKNVNDTLYDVYTYMGKNKNEIQNLFDTNGIYYPIFDKNNK
jgi:hypothetical protein